MDAPEKSTPGGDDAPSLPTSDEAQDFSVGGDDAQDFSSGDGAARKFLIGDDAEGVAREAARLFVRLSARAVAARGRFSVALAGGSTPRRCYELLAGEMRDEVEWPRVHVFFGDERCVPPEHADSNYRMARESLLARVAVPVENVHRMIGEGDAAANARLYEGALRSFFRGETWPRFDLVLLGLGEDGHTASLFPNTPALGEFRAWVAANWVEKLKARRLTLTVPAVNGAACVAFLVTGANKARAMAEVISGPREPLRLPAQFVNPTRGTLVWIADKAAASELRARGVELK